MLNAQSKKFFAVFAFLSIVPLTISCSGGATDFDSDQSGPGSGRTEYGSATDRNTGLLDPICDEGGSVDYRISTACWYVVPAGTDCSNLSDGGCYGRGEMHPDTLSIPNQDLDSCVELLTLVGEEFAFATHDVVESVAPAVSGIGCAVSGDHAYVDLLTGPSEFAKSDDLSRLCGCTM